METPEDAYKVIVSVPEDHAEHLMDELDKVITPFYPGYRRCFCITDSIGTWVPLEGSHPFIGTLGKKEYVNEKRLEFIVRNDELQLVLGTIEKVHPYEEPAVDVIPCRGWRSYLQSSFSTGL